MSDPWEGLPQSNRTMDDIAEAMAGFKEDGACTFEPCNVVYEGQINCPTCHGEVVEHEDGTDEIHPDHDRYCSPGGTRGEFIRIPLRCGTCGQQFSVLIANHKGTELMSITVPF